MGLVVFQILLAGVLGVGVLVALVAVASRIFRPRDRETQQRIVPLDYGMPGATPSPARDPDQPPPGPR